MTNFELMDSLYAARTILAVKRAEVGGPVMDFLLDSFIYLGRELKELQADILAEPEPEIETCESCGQSIEDHGPYCDTDPRPVRTVINGAVLR